MKKFNFYYMLAAALLAISIPACKDKDEDPTNSVHIHIEEPTNGEVIATANCGTVHVHIEFEASVENHEVEVVLHPEGDVNDKIIDFHLHDHDKVITFEQEVDLCVYPAGTCFHLEVQACIDHDCETLETTDIEFCLQ